LPLSATARRVLICRGGSNVGSFMTRDALRWIAGRAPPWPPSRAPGTPANFNETDDLLLNEALALLAFAGVGRTPDRPGAEAHAFVSQVLQDLLDQEHPSGHYSQASTPARRLQSQAICALTLNELAAAGGNAPLRQAARRANRALLEDWQQFKFPSGPLR